MKQMITSKASTSQNVKGVGDKMSDTRDIVVNKKGVGDKVYS